MWLNVCMVCTKQLTRSFSCNFFCNVNTFTSTIITLSGIALCVFICKHTSHSRKYRFRNYIFTCNKLNVSSLT